MYTKGEIRIGGMKLSDNKSTLYDLRRSRRMTQKELAEQTGLTERTTITYEMDIKKFRKAKYETVENIAKILGVSIDQIFLSDVSEIPKQEKEVG